MGDEVIGQRLRDPEQVHQPPRQPLVRSESRRSARRRLRARRAATTNTRAASAASGSAMRPSAAMAAAALRPRRPARHPTNSGPVRRAADLGRDRVMETNPGQDVRPTTVGPVARTPAQRHRSRRSTAAGHGNDGGDDRELPADAARRQRRSDRGRIGDRVGGADPDRAGARHRVGIARRSPRTARERPPDLDDVPSARAARARIARRRSRPGRPRPPPPITAAAPGSSRCGTGCPRPAGRAETPGTSQPGELARWTASGGRSVIASTCHWITSGVIGIGPNSGSVAALARLAMSWAPYSGPSGLRVDPAAGRHRQQLAPGRCPASAPPGRPPRPAAAGSRPGRERRRRRRRPSTRRARPGPRRRPDRPVTSRPR